MQRERSTESGETKDAKDAFVNQMTRFEIVECGCGHEWVRPKGRPNTLPCGKCLNAKLSIRNLLAGPPVEVQACA